MNDPDDFGLIVIGDEVLRGRRRDRHFEAFRVMLDARGYLLAWFIVLPDDPVQLVVHLQRSMNEGKPVFCCGGIGATPDDHTRRCAAEAAGVALGRHPEAAALIEQQFGDGAYPTRILMADLPVGAGLIPNPFNRIPGFFLRHHYFLPGFPELAHPMADWVLDSFFAAGAEPEREVALHVYRTPESRLVKLMEELGSAYPAFKMFSLPQFSDDGYIELGFRGRGDLRPAFDALQQRLLADDIAFTLPDANR